MKLAGYNDVKEGDILEAYRIEEVARACNPVRGRPGYSHAEQ